MAKYPLYMAIDKVKYWLDIADYDFETAEAMYSTRRWLYAIYAQSYATGNGM